MYVCGPGRMQLIRSPSACFAMPRNIVGHSRRQFLTYIHHRPSNPSSCFIFTRRNARSISNTRRTPPQPPKTGIDNPFTTLGISKDASADDVKAAYLPLAKKFHPDVNKAPGAKQMFQKIQEARHELTESMPAWRAYERQRSEYLRAQAKERGLAGARKQVIDDVRRRTDWWLSVKPQQPMNPQGQRQGQGQGLRKKSPQKNNSAKKQATELKMKTKPKEKEKPPLTEAQKARIEAEEEAMEKKFREQRAMRIEKEERMRQVEEEKAREEAEKERKILFWLHVGVVIGLFPWALSKYLKEEGEDVVGDGEMGEAGGELEMAGDG